MRVYYVHPNTPPFDRSAAVEIDEGRALDIIAEIIADSLREGGDSSHQAVVSEEPTDIDTPPSPVAVGDRGKFVALTRRLLDPNDALGGDIRSALNCRAATFGYDGQAFLCLRHSDAPPVSPEPDLVIVAERSDWLSETDWLDGGWPAA